MAADAALSRPALQERAPAKVNLTLHIRGRLDNGYHALESLVVFAGVHDRLSLTPGPDFGLSVSGPRAAASGPAADNLVLKAARLLDERFPLKVRGEFALLKRLPAAAGIGGGSADAAAALRLLCQANGLKISHPAVLSAASATGADVPVCLAPRAQMMRGIGAELSPVGGLPPLFAVMVNPGVAVETRAAFQAIGLTPGQDRSLPPHPRIDADVLSMLAACRNDFEPSAIAQEPVIADVLARLGALPGNRLARMSGSGATCFGLFSSCREAAQGARLLRQDHPGWWIVPTALR
jgi:4-diphosphocytidyl-2-C-methyl-D-erythritol kinase